MDAQTIRGFTLGALDGMTSLLALVLGVYVYGVPDHALFVTATGAAIAGALSMGFMEAASMRIHNAHDTSATASPHKVGLASFLAFLIGSALVIFPLLLGIVAVVVVGVLGLFWLGYFASPEDHIRAGLVTLGYGSLACVAALGVGLALGSTIS